MTCLDLPTVDPLLVRRFTPRADNQVDWFGGVLIWSVYDVEDVGLVTERLAYDEPVVDCSRRIFEITTAMILTPDPVLALTVFPSRRWRNYRTGEQIDREPDADHPLLYLGNPIRLRKDAEGIHVERRAEFLIQSGVELGY